MNIGNTLTDQDFAALFKRPPREAMAYLKRKGIAVSWDWHEMLDAIHQRVFTVAGLLKVDALETVRQSLVDALEQGLPYREWVKRLGPELEKRGLLGRHALLNPETGEVKTLAPWRLRTIYQTNMQAAHMAGRWAEMKEAADSHPYWQYVAVMDSRTRPAHARLNGLVFRHDDPFWDSFYPPLGYNCRCRVIAISQARLERRSLAVSSSQGRLSSGEVEITGGLFPRTATVARFTVGPRQVVSTDPGFNASPAVVGDVLAKQLSERRAAFEAAAKDRSQ